MEWCSKSENEKHAYRTGLKTSKASIQNLRKAQEISRNFWGEKMPWAKLKEKDVKFAIASGRQYFNLLKLTIARK